MKSAKEILGSKGQVWITEEGEMEDEYSHIEWKYAIEAMEEYASQFKTKLEDCKEACEMLANDNIRLTEDLKSKSSTLQEPKE